MSLRWNTSDSTSGCTCTTTTSVPASSAYTWNARSLGSCAAAKSQRLASCARSGPRRPSRRRFVATRISGPGMVAPFCRARSSALPAGGPGRLLPHRDVLLAVVAERLAVPAAPPVAQRHPGEPGHQVELRRPHVAERHREDVEPAVDRAVVVRDQALG